MNDNVEYYGPKTNLSQFKILNRRKVIRPLNFFEKYADI